MDIHELFEAAGNLHGHLCPGLAIGVRAAAEAGGLLHGELRCAIESRACWADGFQSVLGATVGNGMLCLRETGKPVFNFYGAGGELTREDFLQIRCGVPVCADCAEKQSPDR